MAVKLNRLSHLPGVLGVSLPRPAVGSAPSASSICSPLAARRMGPSRNSKVSLSFPFPERCFGDLAAVEQNIVPGTSLAFSLRPPAVLESRDADHGRTVDEVLRDLQEKHEKVLKKLSEQPQKAAEVLEFVEAHLVAEIILASTDYPKLEERSIFNSLRKSSESGTPSVFKEFDCFDSLLVLRAMVLQQCYDRNLMREVVDRIEGRYFSMDRRWPKDHAALAIFPNTKNFRTLIDRLSFDFKVKLIVSDEVHRDRGRLSKKKMVAMADAKAAWKTMDPVDMEAKEKRQHNEGRIKVLSTRKLQARVTRMEPGKRLRAALAVQLMEAVPYVQVAELARIAQAFSYKKGRVLHGDMQADFQEAISKRLLTFEIDDVRPHVLAFASTVSTFEGPASFQAWRKKVLPAVMWTLREKVVDKRLDQQRFFNPMLRGLRHTVTVDAKDGSPKDPRLIRLERSASLFISVTTSRHIQVDTMLFDALANPLKRFLREFLDLRREEPTAKFPLEALADVASAVASSGVRDPELSTLVADVFIEQFAKDVRENKFELSAYSMSDVAAIAHTMSISGIEKCADVMDLLWNIGKPKMRETEPYLVLMFLDSLIRGSSEELYMSQEVRDVVDEMLTQNLDYEASDLGRIGY